MTSNYTLIKQAILSHSSVRAMYKGYLRELCPHALGTKGDREQGLFYQFGGYSSSGLQPDGSKENWRCMRIDELSDIELMPGGWHTAPNHSRPSKCIDVIDVQVDF